MMSSRYKGCSRYIGHVGALAVALGLGGAVVTGTGVAWASEGSADGGTSSSSAGAQSDTSAQSDKPAPAAVQHDTTDAAATKPSNEKDSAEKDLDKANSPAAQEHNDASESDPADSPAGSEPPARQGNTSSRRAEPADVTEVAKAEAAPAIEKVAPRATAVDLVVDTVKDLTDPFSGGTPATPADSPAQWMEAAAARREVGPSSTGPVTTDVTVTLTQQVITGGVNAKDVNKQNTLSYEVVGNPDAGGKVALDATKGTFTFLPDESVVNKRGTETFQVKVSELTPIVAALQTLPVIGDWVRPAVVFLRGVPVVGQLLAPIIGVSIVVPVAVDIRRVVPRGTPIAFTTMVKSPVDGTLISTNFFPALGLTKGKKAPTIFDGAGLSQAGDTDPFTVDGNRSYDIATFRAAGYNVVTWDPRGEHASGGVLKLDSPDYEAGDVSGIITWLAHRPEAQLDGKNDPRMGMVGFSYGGGIQLVTAATDDRVDAIVPGIAWHTLTESLYRDNAFRTGYAVLLMLDLVASGARVDPEIYPAIISGALTGTLTAEQQAILASSGPGDLIKNIKAPTLLLQGTVDVLFPLQQAITNAQILQAANVPVKMVWFCGGHGDCETPNDDNAEILSATMAWLDRWVKGNKSVDTGAKFEWIDQSGQYWSSNILPTDKTFHGGSIQIDGGGAGGVLPIIPLVGSGPSTHVDFPYSIGDGEVASVAINVPIEPGVAAQIVGSPELTFSYSGLGTATHIYAQLIDNNTGLVIGNLVTPVSVTLDGTQQTAHVSLEAIAQTMSATDSLTLQLVGSATAYENLTSVGLITISDVELSLPTVAAGVATKRGTTSIAAA